MGSLTAHLVEDGDHGRLGFHPSCPVCRKDRLFGSLSPEPVISRRIQAALATGVLAFSAAAPAVAVAGEPDRQQEGVAAPEQPTDGSPQQPDGGDLNAPDFDPGGETALPVEVAPVTGGGTDDMGDGPPVESEPVDDPEGRLLATEPDKETPTTDGDAAVPPAVEPPDSPAPRASDPVPTEAAPADPETPAGPETPAAPSTPAASLQSEVDPKESASERTRVLTGTAESDQAPSTNSGSGPPAAPYQPPATTIHAEGSPPASPIPAPAAEPVQLTQASARAQTAEPAPAKNVRSELANDARFHVVQAGESLWSIARKLLGAGASPAQIAREVNRLWELNKDRIGTGDPDLLKVGTRLTLR